MIIRSSVNWEFFTNSRQLLYKFTEISPTSEQNSEAQTPQMLNDAHAILLKPLFSEDALLLPLSR